MYRIIVSIFLCFSRDRKGVKFTLCCQPQLPQWSWKTLNLYFYAIFNLALMGIRQKTPNWRPRQINQLYSIWFCDSSKWENIAVGVLIIV